MTPLTSQYLKSFNYTNATNSPISGVRFALSRPCADLSKNYVSRTLRAHRLLQNQQTECAMSDNQKQHELFFPTNYTTNELAVYQQNNLVSKIREKIPDYNESSLKLNNYSVFYRTYPKWDVQCQELYSTYDFAEEGKKLGYA